MKRKFSLFLSTVLFCLSICAIAFGVYSAQNTNLSLNGKLGFNTYDTILNIVSSVCDMGDFTTVVNADKIIHGGDNNSEILSMAVSLGEFCFNYDNITGSAIDKQILLELFNGTDSDIVVTINQPTFDSDIAILGEQYDQQYIDFDSTGKIHTKITAGDMNYYYFGLRLNDISKLSSKVDFNLQISIDKNPLPIQTGTFTKYTGTSTTTSITRNYVTMGQVSSANATALKWFLFAKGDVNGSNMTKVDGAVTTNGALSAGTYWFISEYALDYKAYGTNTCSAYDGSTVQSFLNSTATTGFSYIHNIASTNVVYKKIGIRSFPGVPNKFWLPSLAECTYLNDGNACSSGKTYYPLKTLTTGKSTAYWWLRDVSGTNSAYRVYTTGAIGTARMITSGTYRVRPAFQITIT